MIGLCARDNRLFQEANDVGVAVVLTIAGLDSSDDGVDDPSNCQSEAQRNTDAEKPANHGDGKINGIGDLKIKDLLAGFINQRAVGLFDHPDDQWGQNMC